MPVGALALCMQVAVAHSAERVPCNNATLERSPEAAIVACQEALKAPGLDKEAISGFTYILGRGYHRTGQAREAIAYYDTALEGDPHNAEILVSRGWARFSSNDFRAAQTSVEEAIRADVKNERAWQLRGYLLQSQNRVSDALESYAHALRLNPDFGGALYHRAALERDIGRFDAAIEDLDRLIAVPVERVGHGGLLDGNGRVISFHAQAHAMRAQLMASRGNLTAAEADWDRTIAIEPTAENYAGRAEFYQAHTTGRIPDSLRDIRSARSLAPRSIYYWRLEAWLMGLNKQTDEALAEFDKLENHNPKDFTFPLMRMDLLRRAGRGDEAQAATLKTFNRAPEALWPLVEHLASEGHWKGDTKPKTLTPELKQAFEACNKNPAC